MSATVAMLKEAVETPAGVLESGSMVRIVATADTGYDVEALHDGPAGVVRVSPSLLSTPVPIRDYYEHVEALEDMEPYGPVLIVGGHEVLAKRCHDCGRPSYYDYTDDRYHHAVDAAVGCFLIGPEDRDDDPDHPLYRRPGLLSRLRERQRDNRR